MHPTDRNPLVWAARTLGRVGLWRFFLHWITRYVVAWLIALGGAGTALYYSWHVFDASDRSDGNVGHVFIDFGGQYLMGRMLVKGHAGHLYNRNDQRAVLWDAYPGQNENDHHDAEDLMGALMSFDDRDPISSMVVPLACRTPLDLIGAAGCCMVKVERPGKTGDQEEWNASHLKDAVAARGGPLYPPINAFVYAPLGLLPPQWGYRANQLFGFLLAFVAGLGVRQISRGRIWWPVASALLIPFPGFIGSLNLGQNAALTLTILVWGWALMARGRPTWGGIVWGLLAFKPVWALAYFLVPLLTGRWRVCLAMGLTGVCLAAATLPVVGWHTWVHWLEVGKIATILYQSDKNWIQLGREVLSIPRKAFNFEAPDAARQQSLLANLIGWTILIGSLELTIRVCFLRKEKVRAFTGPGPAFVLLGAWMSCFHFMYYDVLLGALPVFLLLTEPRRYLEPILLALIPLAPSQGGDRLREYYHPRLARDLPALPLLQPGYRHLWVFNRLEPTMLFVLCTLYCVFDLRDPPFDTYCLMGLWAWCGWLLMRHPDRQVVSDLPEELASPGRSIVDPAHPSQLVQLHANVGGAH